MKSIATTAALLLCIVHLHSLRIPLRRCRAHSPLLSRGGVTDPRQPRLSKAYRRSSTLSGYEEESDGTIASDAPLQQMQITFDCTSIDSDELSELMFEIGVLSVSCEVISEIKGRMNDEKNWEDLQKTRNWGTALLRANVPSTFDIEGVKDILAVSYPEYVFDVAIADVVDKDWVLSVQKSWTPINIDDKLVIRFPWHTDEDISGDGGKHIEELVLEGGAAFGTGDHPTTCMCCKWVLKMVDTSTSNGKKFDILDFGTGSGILGLAALKFNPSDVRVDGTDIDRDALLSCYNNCKMNGLESKFDLYIVDSNSNSVHSSNDEINSVLMNNLRGNKDGSRGDGSIIKDISQIRDKKYDIVVANILAPILISLAPEIYNYTKINGKIALSGLVIQQKDAILSEYSKYFDDVEVTEVMDDWILVTGERKR